MIHNDYLPINISLDSQLLFNFLIENYYANEIIRLHNIVKSEQNKELRKEASISLNFCLGIYPLLSFYEHLLSTGKIKLNITPTAYSELINSKLLEDFTPLLLQDPDIRGYYISNAEINAIMNQYLNRKDFVKIDAYMKWHEQVKEKALDFTTIPDDDTTYNIQLDIIEKAKKNIFHKSFEPLGDNVKFIYLDNNQQDTKKSLRQDIYKLSERYGMDRKRIKPNSDRKELSDVQISKEEINDRTIMATCALLHLPLITEDKQALSGKLEIYKEENKRFSKENPNRIAIGEPLTASDFIIGFFKEEFIEFIQNFQIPNQIKNIDTHKTISSSIDKILSTPTRQLFVKNNKTSEHESCLKNRERYQHAFRNTELSEAKFLSTEEFFNPLNPHIAKETAESVLNYRRSSILTTAIITLDNITKNKNDLLELKKNFWGIKELKGDKILETKSPSTPIALAIQARRIWYNTLVAFNHLIKQLYGVHKSKLDEEILQIFESLNIQIIYDNNSKINSIQYNGLSFGLPKDMDLDKARLIIQFNPNNLSEDMLLMLGINPFTVKHASIADTFNEYIKDFPSKNKNANISTYNSYTFKYLGKEHPEEYENTIMHHDQQIHALRGAFGQGNSMNH